MHFLRVLQWNCRSLSSARVDLHILISNVLPDIILLQESWLGADDAFHMADFYAFRLNRSIGRGGGLVVLVSKMLPHAASVGFQCMSSDCEALLVNFTLPGSRHFSISNVYFPKGVQDIAILDRLVNNSHGDYIIAGDFNSHHVAWGFRTDSAGSRLWNWICDEGVNVENTGSPTFWRGSSSSVLDLTLSSASFRLLKWTTVDDGTNSEHFPITFQLPIHADSVTRCVRTFVNNSKIVKIMSDSLDRISELIPEERSAEIISFLTVAVQKASHVVSAIEKKSFAPWWNTDCARDYRRRKAAQKKLFHNSSPTNWNNYQFHKASFKRTVSAAKATYYLNKNEYLSNPAYRKALFRWVSSLGPRHNPSSTSSVLSIGEAKDSLERIGQDLERRFCTALQPGRLAVTDLDDFPSVSLIELEEVMRALPSTAPGPDGISAGVLKQFMEHHGFMLLDLVNHSLGCSWLHPCWKLSKVILLKKNPSLGLQPDNIRPIALTSIVVKTIERILFRRMSDFVSNQGILSSCQIGFRPGCSIWFAHILIESEIRLAKTNHRVSALVTLDIAKAYDSVEHIIMLRKLASMSFPAYMVAWIQEFFTNRSFFCFSGALSSRTFQQSRGLPQGSVLSPLLFNILMSAIPLDPDITTIVYADDIAFFASSENLQSLYAKLQSYLNRITNWLSDLCLTINVNKCSILVFPLDAFITIQLYCGRDIVPQVTKLKYLGVFYDEKLSWKFHIDHIACRGSQALGLLRRCSHRRIGMRRSTLILLYKCYVRPILEFGCVLFSGLPMYKLRPLVLLERQALRLCLGLPRYVANNVLYLEARLPSLVSRFQLLTVQSIIRVFNSHFVQAAGSNYLSLSRYLSVSWRRANTPQIVFAQSLLSSIRTSLLDIRYNTVMTSPVCIFTDNIFGADSHVLTSAMIVSVVQDYLNGYRDHLQIATDGSVIQEKAGIGIYVRHLEFSFSVRLPDYIPIYEAEMLAMLLALRKVPATFTKVVILSDSRSVSDTLGRGVESKLFREFCGALPAHITEVRLVWVPGHRGVPDNEAADYLARSSLDLSPLTTLPVLPSVVCAQFRRYLTLSFFKNDSLLFFPEFQHLRFPWNTNDCVSRQCETTLTRMRCRIPDLNFYAHRIGHSVSPLCSFCQEAETLDHYLLTCRRFVCQRNRFLRGPFSSLGTPLSLPLILSFGASSANAPVGSLRSALHNFILATKRLIC